MNTPGYRNAIIDYIRSAARPPDKFSHQARLYRLACVLAGDRPYDEDVIFGAAWMHDLGVFIGHRPQDPTALAVWDHLAYAMREAPPTLSRLGFPLEKIPAVIEAIRTHQPAAAPTTFEAMLIHDADILEQLGAVSVLRTVCKIGRDTRFVRFSDAIRVLRNNAADLPCRLRLESARQLAEPRCMALVAFLDAAESEASGVEW
jgi:uncharacterized protein